jgi:hypothetical protein
MDGLIDVIESDVLTLVSKAAPLLGSVLGTPLAGIAISLIAHAFGVDSKNLTNLTNVMRNDPEAAIKLKTLEYEHAEVLAKVASSDFATEVSDKKDARQYSVIYKDFLRHMAYMVTVGFFLALFMMFIPLHISAEEKNLLSMLVGMLASKWQTIIDFFFGSTHPNSQGATSWKQ